MLDQYYRVGHAYIFVFALDTPGSKAQVVEKYNTLLIQKDIVDRPELSPPVIVVGNKSDLKPPKRIVTEEEGHELANSLGNSDVQYIETSAKENHNIKELFEMIVQAIKRKESLAKEEGKKGKKKK